MATTSTFRFELGFNRSAASIRRALALYPLQGQLIRFSPGESLPWPAWNTSFHVDDKFSFRLVDITDLEQPDPSAATPSLIGIPFADPVTGDPARPFTVMVESWEVLDESAMMRWSPAYSLCSSQLLPTWDLQAMTQSQGDQTELVFAAVDDGFQRYEFSVRALIARSEQEQNANYVLDPEIIISDGGQ